MCSGGFPRNHVGKDFAEVVVSAYHSDHQRITIRQGLLWPLAQLGEIVEIRSFHLIIARDLLLCHGANAEGQNREAQR